MADERNPEKAMAGMLKRKGVWPSAATGDACPEAATLAAYFDRSLSAPEAAQWEMHFSACARCQEHLATLVRSEPATPGRAGAESKPLFSWLWDWRWLAPLGAAAVALLFWVSYETLRAPAGVSESGQMMAKREVPGQAPATKTEASPAAAPAGKPLSAQRMSEERRAFDEAASKKSAEVAAPAEVELARKDRARPAVGAGAGTQVARAPQKPATEKTQVTTTAARAVAPAPPAPVGSAVAQAEAAKTQQKVAEADRSQAAPAENVAPGVQGLQVETRSAVAAEKKEGVAQAQSDVRALRRPAAEKQEGAAAKQAPADAQIALGVTAGRRAKFARTPDEFIVSTPNPKVLWRIGPSGLIERSRDAGKTWQRQTSSTQEPLLAGSAPMENICWAVGGNGVLLRTTDGGDNWERIPSPTQGDIIAVKARDQFNVTVVGADGRTYETRNAGVHWRLL